MDEKGCQLIINKINESKLHTEIKKEWYKQNRENVRSLLKQRIEKRDKLVSVSGQRNFRNSANK